MTINNFSKDWLYGLAVENDKKCRHVYNVLQPGKHTSLFDEPVYLSTSDVLMVNSGDTPTLFSCHLVWPWTRYPILQHSYKSTYVSLLRTSIFGTVWCRKFPFWYQLLRKSWSMSIYIRTERLLSFLMFPWSLYIENCRCGIKFCTISVFRKEFF